MKTLLFQTFLLFFLGVVLSNNATGLSQIKATTEVSVTGFSSGGAMAGQMLVAHSSLIKGAGILASPPYFCTQGNMLKMLDCITNGFGVHSDQLVNAAEGFEQYGLIDELSNLEDTKIFFFSGLKDTIVWNSVVKKNQEFFTKLGADIEYEYMENAEHSFPTDFFGNNCNILGKPFINDCEFKGSRRSLQHIFGEDIKPKIDYKEENIKSFSQKKYMIGMKHSLAESGLIYVPEACNQKECELHVVFHGCEQTVPDIGLDYVYGTGFLGLAEANDIIVLYPQLKKDPLIGNPQGCWDWWGYSESIPKPLQWVFPTKQGVQIQAVYGMINDLQKGQFLHDSEFAFKDIPKSSY